MLNWIHIWRVECSIKQENHVIFALFYAFFCYINAVKRTAEVRQAVDILHVYKGIEVYEHAGSMRKIC